MSFGVNRVDRMSAFAAISDQYYDSFIQYLPTKRSLTPHLKRHRSLLILLLLVVLTSLVYLFTRLGGLHLKRPVYKYPTVEKIQTRVVRPYNDPGGAKSGKLALLSDEGFEGEAVSLTNPTTRNGDWGAIQNRFTISSNEKGNSVILDTKPLYVQKVRKLEKPGSYYEVEKLEKPRPKANIEKVLLNHLEEDTMGTK